MHFFAALLALFASTSVAATIPAQPSPNTTTSLKNSNKASYVYINTTTPRSLCDTVEYGSKRPQQEQQRRDANPFADCNAISQQYTDYPGYWSISMSDGPRPSGWNYFRLGNCSFGLESDLQPQDSVQVGSDDLKLILSDLLLSNQNERGALVSQVSGNMTCGQDGPVFKSLNWTVYVSVAD